jgi:hypothetical protein
MVRVILNVKNAVDPTVDLPEEYQDSIRSYHSHSQQFCDGDIYRNIRFYEARMDTGKVDIWMNRLGNKQTDIKTLNQRQNDELRKAFDDLVPFVGLWADFRAGMLKRVLTMKCTEVSLLCFYDHLLSLLGTCSLPYAYSPRMGYDTRRSCAIPIGFWFCSGFATPRTSLFIVRSVLYNHTVRSSQSFPGCV